MAEVSTKPYLVRAIHEWCVDSGYRPFIAVLVDERTLVPREFVRNGEIVLNISAVAVNRLRIGNELLEFEARFSGVARQVSIPIENIRAIFAQETGHGMAFEIAPAPRDDESDASDSSEDASVSPGAETGESIDRRHTGGRTGDAPSVKHARKTVLRDVSAGTAGEARPKSGASKTTPGGGNAATKRSRKPTVVEVPEDAKHRPARGRTRRDFPDAPPPDDDGSGPGADAPVSPAAETGESIDRQHAGGRTGDARPAKRARKTVLRDVSAGTTGEARPKSGASKTTPGGDSAGAKRSRKPTVVEVPEDAKDRPAQGRTGRDSPDPSPPDDDGPGPGAPTPGKPRLTRVK